MDWELLIPITFGVDYLVKEKIEKQPDELSVKYCKGNLEIGKLHNYGMAGGRLSGKPQWVLGLASAATVFAFGFLLKNRETAEVSERIGISLMAGGALSNLTDRIRKGYVVDYINFPKSIGKIKKLVFNISDFCIFVGGLLLIINGWKHHGT